MEVLVGGAPIRPTAIYACATVDFVAIQGPEKYLGFVPQNVYDHSIVLSHAVEQAVRSGGVVTAAIEGRLIVDDAARERR
jgi:hypothetical protein